MRCSCSSLIHVMGIIAAIIMSRPIGTTMSFYRISGKWSSRHGKVGSTFVIVVIHILGVCRVIILESGRRRVIIGVIAGYLVSGIWVISGHRRIVLLALVRVIVVCIRAWCNTNVHR